MNLTPIIRLLERRIGLDAASLGPTAADAAVTQRMQALGITDPVVYWDRLRSDTELAALTDRLIVPETWFFRGEVLFEELARRVSVHPRPVFRALSLPCSTGEEPYSLAIAFLDAGINPAKWSVDGIDISPRLITAARRGVYRQYAFRQMAADVRDRWFRQVGDEWEISPTVRERVRFRIGNVMDSAMLADEWGSYDLVMCRNLLIYLTPSARRQAIDLIERLLTPGGLLAIGHAEPQLLAGRPFVRVGADACFLFHRNDVAMPAPDSSGSNEIATGAWPVSKTASAAIESTVITGSDIHPATSALDSVRRETPTASPRPFETMDNEDALKRARTLADSGRLDEALAVCQWHIEVQASSASAFSLLGVIQQARGDKAAAAEAFRKALYLDPNDRDALTQSMLISAERGESGRAAELRERLIRTDTGGER